MKPNICFLLALLNAYLVLALFPARAAQPADGAGSITGTVSNTATSNLLAGAKVELPQLGLSVLTDETGRFVFPAVPAGTHELAASYVGLDPLRVQVSYQQQFTLLPGVLKGLGVAANYTMLSTHGDFGGSTILGTRQVVGFIPRAANVMLSWRYGRFSAGVLHNMTGSYIAEYSAASPARNPYRFRMDRINLGLAYQLRPAVSLTCDINNLFNEPQRLYRGIPDRMARTIINGTTINGGVSGRF